MFKGNVNGDTIRLNKFEVPIIAQWIRINPTRWRDRISLRVELYGCEYGKTTITDIKYPILFVFSNFLTTKSFQKL